MSGTSVIRLLLLSALFLIGCAALQSHDEEYVPNYTGLYGYDSTVIKLNQLQDYKEVGDSTIIKNTIPAVRDILIQHNYKEFKYLKFMENNDYYYLYVEVTKPPELLHAKDTKKKKKKIKMWIDKEKNEVIKVYYKE
jgi:outer membrane lipoprotein-sorting protein